jgi:hypothetical protein
MDLYNYSVDFQKTMYYIDGKHYNADHARVQDDDAEGDLEDAQEDGFLTRHEDFATRRQRIKDAYEKATQLINQLGDDVPEEWIHELKRGARVEQYTALSSTDKMEMFFWIQKQRDGETVEAAIQKVHQRMQNRVEEWKSWDPESFKAMQGEDVFAHWERMDPDVYRTLIEAAKKEFPGAEELEIDTDDDVYDVDGKTADGRDFDLDITPEGHIVEHRVEVELSELLDVVQALIQKELDGGGHLDGLMHCKDEGEEEYYEIEIDRDDDELQLKITPDGRVLEREWD